MKFILNKLRDKNYLISLAFSTGVYFILTRVLQDWFYNSQGLNVRPVELFNSYGRLFMRPEPLEIFLYILGYTLVPIIALFFVPLVRDIIAHKKYVIPLGLGIGSVAIISVLTKLPWDYYLNYLQTKEILHIFWFVTTKRVLVTYIIILLSVVFFGAYYFWGNTKPLIFYKDNVERFFKKIWPLGLIILALLIFNPSLPINVHHYNYFIGAVHDVFQGKGLLYETSHLYGLFDVYFLFGLFSIIPLSYANFALLIMIIFFIFFAGLWLFTRRWLKSYALATLAVGVLVAIIYFFQTSPSRSVLFLPAMSPFRWGLYLPVLFLMLGWQKTNQAKYLHWAYFFSAFALFWNFDSGLFLTATTMITSVYIYLSKNWDIKGVFKAGFSFLGYFVGIFVVVNIINRIIYGAWPQWELFFRESKYFSQGIAMYPLPIFGVFEIIFFTYLMVLLFALYNLVKQKEFNKPLLFLALYGIFSFIYYIGESSWQILYVVTGPFVLILFYVFNLILQDKEWITYKKLAKTGIYTLIFFGLILLAFKLPVEFSNRNYSEFKFKLLQIQPEEQETYEDAQYIKQNYSQERIAVMSLNDTKLYLYSGKVNYYDFYYIFTIYFESEMQRYIDQTLREMPQVVLVGKGDWSNDQVEFFLTGIKDKYELKKSLKTVDIYELKTIKK